MHARFHVLTAIVCWARLLRADRGWPTVATTFLHTARFAGTEQKVLPLLSLNVRHAPPLDYALSPEGQRELGILS